MNLRGQLPQALRLDSGPVPRLATMHVVVCLPLEGQDSPS